MPLATCPLRERPIADAEDERFASARAIDDVDHGAGRECAIGASPQGTSLTLTQTTDRYLGHRMSCAGPLGLRLHRVPNLVAAGGAQEYNSSTIAASRERRDLTTPAARRAGRKHLRHTKAVEDMCTTTVRRQLVPESSPVKRTSEDNHDQKCHCRRPTQAEPKPEEKYSYDESRKHPWDRTRPRPALSVAPYDPHAKQARPSGD